MRILTLGDVVGHAAIDYLSRHLWDLRRAEKIDLVIANGENASDIRGICAADARALLDTGVDAITLGNHAFGRRDLYPLLDSEDAIVRPANYPPEAPGNGYTILNVNGYRVLLINVCGRVYLDPLADPFVTVERILDREEGRFDFAVMDVHAEATSEKLAMAYSFDGRISVMFGTHTHVPTADEEILPRGSGYITDLGMCGPKNDILGTDRDAVIRKFRTMLPTAFSVAEGETVAMGAIFDVDTDSGRVRDVRRIRF
jgi:metallophosphoesterase (TIGR00282 family)